MPRLVFTVNNVEFLLSHRLVLVEGAREAGYEVIVIGPEGPAVKRLTAMKVPFYRWKLDRKSQAILDEAAAVSQLTQLYETLRPDLAHHVTVKPILYGSIAAQSVGLKRVVNAVSGLGYVFLAEGAAASLRRRLVAGAYRLATSLKGSVTILQNDDDEADLKAAGALGTAKVVKIRGSGVDLAQFQRRPEPEGVPLVVLPARLLRDKGVVEFVDAARSLKRRGLIVRMALVGGLDDGNPAALTRSDVDGWVKEGVVEWWGQRDDMPEVLRQANIVCLPSYREGLPRALLEAGAVGRAIITTDVPGCRDVVAKGALGVLVPAKQSEPIADAVAQLVNDPARRKALADAIAAEAAKSFGQEHVLAAHLAVYRDLMLDVA